LKIATWNVNGIRARHAQVQEWIARERPDVVCLQEIKAASEQVPALLFDLEGYWCYWHGGKGYSGVALHISKTVAQDRPAFSHPDFNFENRIAAVDVRTATGTCTIASVYVPNGGKDFPAKMRFLESMDAYAQSFQDAGRNLVLCGDMNVARTELDVHPKERKATAIGQLPEERALLERIIGRASWTSDARSTRTTTACSPGGRPGATCGSATSAGDSTTSLRPSRSPQRPQPVPC
jgi:exodeoxyribonuclease-3